VNRPEKEPDEQAAAGGWISRHPFMFRMAVILAALALGLIIIYATGRIPSGGE
jgi:hypothetical protein